MKKHLILTMVFAVMFAGSSVLASAQNVKVDSQQTQLLLAASSTTTLQQELDKAGALGFRERSRRARRKGFRPRARPSLFNRAWLASSPRLLRGHAAGQAVKFLGGHHDPAVAVAAHREDHLAGESPFARLHGGHHQRPASTHVHDRVPDGEGVKFL